MEGGFVASKEQIKVLRRQAKEILAQAEEKGVKTNYLFATTFDRYQMQLSILEKLAAEIEEIGVTVKKEYVKGRRNTYVNPAITEYNKTATAANGTASALINIITAFEDEKGKPAASKLEQFINGG